MRHVDPATTTTVTADTTHVRIGKCMPARHGRALWLLLALAIAPVLQAMQDQPAVDVAFTADEGTWMSLDVAPDGKHIAFDLLGDLYSVGIDGGAAVALVSGESFDTQPVFSPDGREIAFISDRDGSENLWIAAADGTGARALSRGNNGVLVGPAWSADGGQVFVTRFEQRNRLVGDIPGTLWSYPHAGGAGTPMPSKPKADSAQSAAARDKTGADSGLRGIGASATADGRYLYFASGGEGNYEIRRRDLRSGQVLTAIHGPRQGPGFFQPVPSPDGRYIAYATGWEGSTELRLRSLVDGSDRRLAYPIEPTLAAEPIPFQGLLPRYAFTPDSTAIVIAHGGKLRRVDLRNAEQQTIPFRANVALQAHRSPRPGLTDEDGPVRARFIQASSLSPDGSRIAFSAFGKVYQMALSDGVAKRLTDTPLTADAATENQPAWSPDGQWIAYTSWSRRDGGQVWRIRSDGSAAPVQITRTPGYYRKPVYAPDGASLLVLRSWMHEQLQLIVPRGYDPQRPFLQDLVRIPLADGSAGGDGTLVTQLPGFTGAIDHGRPVFHPSLPLVWIHTRDGLQEIALDGTSTRMLVKVTTQDYAESSNKGTAVDDLMPSPDGRRLLVLHNHQLYLMDMPASDRTGAGVEVELSGSTPIPSLQRLTEIGADYFGWSSDGRDIFWSVGSSFYRLPLRDAQLQTPSSSASDVGEMCREDALQSYQVAVTLPRDAPRRTHALVLRGGRVVTMSGDEIIENADIVIEGTRIAAVGPRGTVDIPAGASIRDVSGKTITPGFIDTHAHYGGIGRGIIDYGVWEHRAALAYGITASLDPQSYTADMFVYQDLIDAGVMEGPRAYTTGPGIFDTAGATTDRTAACVLRRYRDHYRTGIVKSYMVGDRAHRQHMARAARSLGMLLVAENWGSPRYALTQAIDGFATNEHASDALDYQQDVATLYARLGTGYSPTTLIGGAAGLPAADYFVARDHALDDAKLNRFTPRFVLNARLRRADWVPKENFAFERIAASAAKIFRAGGNLGLGSHSELQGLGYHWEMQVMSMGGLRPHEVLQIATRGSASVLDRRKDMGTIAPGQYADLIIFDRNPLLDIHDTRAFGQLVKNGCLYNADTLEKVGPC